MGVCTVQHTHTHTLVKVWYKWADSIETVKKCDYEVNNTAHGTTGELLIKIAVQRLKCFCFFLQSCFGVKILLIFNHSVYCLSSIGEVKNRNEHI